MARNLVDGGIYHVLTRGNNGLAVFRHEHDYQSYLRILAANATMHRLRIYHYALLPDQVHLVLEVLQGRHLSKAMSGINLSYALAYGRRYRYRGHLWQGRFKSFLVDRQRFLLDCARYVELSPVRAGLAADPTAYAWSSCHAYARGEMDPLVIWSPAYELLGLSPAHRQERYRQFILEGLRKPVDVLADEGQPDRYGLLALQRRRGRPKKSSARFETPWLHPIHIRIQDIDAAKQP
jgi:putative transposase